MARPAMTAVRRRLAGLVLAASLATVLGAVAATPALTPAPAFADDPTASGEVPSDAGPAPVGSPSEADVNPDPMAEPALAWMVAFLVGSGVLFVFGFLAMQVTRPKRHPAKAAGGWWRCSACGQSNASDRSTCFACEAPRPAPPEGQASKASKPVVADGDPDDGTPDDGTPTTPVS